MSSGYEPLIHWDFFQCRLNLPHDSTVDEMAQIPEVTCPECAQALESVRVSRLNGIRLQEAKKK